MPHNTRRLTALACAALVAFNLPVHAAPGDLDLTFGETGIVVTDIGGGSDIGDSVAIQNDGKIVVAGHGHPTASGSYEFALVRYDPDGSLDTTFGGDGKVTTSFAIGGSGDAVGQSVVIQGNGKIVVAGHSNIAFAVARYNSDGSLDTSFNVTGKVTTNLGLSSAGLSVGVQNDGKLVVAGSTSSEIALVRYNVDGSLDTSFNGTGKVTTDFGPGGGVGNSVAIQTDGRIVVAVTNNVGVFAVVRYNADGSLDTSFGGTGKVTTDFGPGDDRGNSVAVQNDGKIVVAGHSSNGVNYDFALVRYNANGSLDTSFNGTGKVSTDFGGDGDVAFSVVVLIDGKIVVAGASSNSGQNNLALARYNANGSLDTTFHGSGRVTTANISVGNGVAVQRDGKIVVAGETNGGVGGTNIVVVRYEGDPDSDGDGIPDIYETGTGIYVFPGNTGTSPTNRDSDGDGLVDGQEVYITHSNPNLADTDGDGFDDGFELSTGFDPLSATSTPDALSSIRTAAEYRFNAALGISYRIEASTDFTNWTTIETNIIGAGGVLTRFYSIEGQPRRFFRSRRN